MTKKAYTTTISAILSGINCKKIFILKSSPLNQSSVNCWFTGEHLNKFIIYFLKLLNPQNLCLIRVLLKSYFIFSASSEFKLERSLKTWVNLGNIFNFKLGFSRFSKPQIPYWEEGLVRFVIFGEIFKNSKKLRSPGTELGGIPDSGIFYGGEVAA